MKETEGKVLLTTGSKELKAFTEIPDYQKRIFARVLSLPSVIEACRELGFEGKEEGIVAQAVILLEARA